MIPIITIASTGPDRFEISVAGRFGGGFIGLETTRAGVLAKLAQLRSYDCADTPAEVVFPEELRAEVAAVFPQVQRSAGAEADSSFLHVRLTPREKAAIVRAANAAGCGLAEWVRGELRAACARD
jgi:hypothetical protein